MTIKDRRRLDDHYSRQARQDGYPARSVYKLEEFDRKYHLFFPGQKVLDLGCAPGSWTLYAAQKVGEKGQVTGLDLNVPAGSFPRQVSLIQADLLVADPLPVNELSYEAVLSDMAPRTSGRREVDQVRSMELVCSAWHWTELMLESGGFFLFKVFQSQEAEEFIRSLGENFARIVRLKPGATRKESQEIFVLGLGRVKKPRI